MANQLRVGTARTRMMVSTVIMKGFMLIKGALSHMALEEQLQSLQLGLGLTILAGLLGFLPQHRVKRGLQILD